MLEVSVDTILVFEFEELVFAIRVLTLVPLLFFLDYLELLGLRPRRLWFRHRDRHFLLDV